MPDILILPIPDETITDALLALLDGLKAANLVTTCAPILVTTDNPHAAALLAPYGRILDEPSAPTSSTPTPKRGGGRKKKTPPTDPVIVPAIFPSSPIDTKLEQDIAEIVRTAGQKKASSQPPPEPSKTPIVGPTLYTNPRTNETITFGEMRTLLQNRRVVANEEFISNRHGRVRVIDRGNKLTLARVETSW